MTLNEQLNRLLWDYKTFESIIIKNNKPMLRLEIDSKFLQEWCGYELTEARNTWVREYVGNFL